jgi:hypothetical protein
MYCFDLGVVLPDNPGLCLRDPSSWRQSLGQWLFCCQRWPFWSGGWPFCLQQWLRGRWPFLGGGGRASLGWWLPTTSWCLVAAPRPLLRHISARLGAGHEMIWIFVGEGGG